MLWIAAKFSDIQSQSLSRGLGLSEAVSESVKLSSRIALTRFTHLHVHVSVEWYCVVYSFNTLGKQSEGLEEDLKAVKCWHLLLLLYYVLWSWKGSYARRCSSVVGHSTLDDATRINKLHPLETLCCKYWCQALLHCMWSLFIFEPNVLLNQILSTLLWGQTLQVHTCCINAAEDSRQAPLHIHTVHNNQCGYICCELLSMLLFSSTVVVTVCSSTLFTACVCAGYYVLLCLSGLYKLVGYLIICALWEEAEIEVVWSGFPQTNELIINKEV